jgi:misacylated tRNA(Ala) deacylase
MTNLLYLTDSYLQEFKAVVTAMNPENHGIILDQSAFYPGGGGQPSDIGKIYTEFSSYQVTQIKRIEGEIVHVLEGNEKLPEVGEAIPHCHAHPVWRCIPRLRRIGDGWKYGTPQG